MSRAVDARRLAVVADSRETGDQNIHAWNEPGTSAVCSYCYGTVMEVVQGRGRAAAAAACVTGGNG